MVYYYTSLSVRHLVVRGGPSSQIKARQRKSGDAVDGGVYHMV
jgi:hypothetical protein